MRTIMLFGFLVILLFVYAPNSFATEQVPDHMIYNNEEGILETTFTYPSPLQVYYQNSKETYPFECQSTANYRGHIASWKVVDDTLYLVKVEIEEYSFNEDKSKYKTNEEIKLEKLFGTNVNNGMVKATWFTGMLKIYIGREKKWYKSPYGDENFYVIDYNTFVFLEVKDGVVTKTYKLSNEEYRAAVNSYYEQEKIGIGGILSYTNKFDNNYSVIEKFGEYIKGFQK